MLLPWKSKQGGKGMSEQTEQKILLVEDDRQFSKTASRMLELKG